MAKPSYNPLQVAEQLDSGHHWSDPVVTYSFPAWNVDPGYPYGGFSAFSYDQQELAKLVLDLWSDVTNLTFEPDGFGEKGQIRFMNSSGLPSQAAGQAEYPGSEHWKGDVHINPSHSSNADMSFGGGALAVLLHEVGHALGLSHPGAYDFDPNNPTNVPTYEEDAEYLEDSNQYTVMSYFPASYTGAMHDTVQGTVFAQTPLLHDIYAIQQIYGTNLTTRAGDTVYGYNSTADRDVFDFAKNPYPVLAIWDGGGNDTLDLSGERSRVRLDLDAGAFSDTAGLTSNVAIAYNAWIENAIGGGGNDTIVGNVFDNVLHGGNGNDELYGQQPDDDYVEGLDEDSDELYGERGNDTLRGGFGTDLLHGGDGDDDLDGGTQDDELNGGSGGDTLVGSAGVDEIHGGSGDDHIYGHRHWTTPENPGDPDWFHDDIDYLYGGDGGDFIYGGFGDDWIEGDGGQDDDGEPNQHTLWTGVDHLHGEEGSDTIMGGEGDDWLYGEDDTDYLYGEGGADHITGGTHRDFLYGGAGADTLDGNDGNDELEGDGGADRLEGDAGEDTLRGDDGNDWLNGGSERDTFSGGAGTDTVSYWDEYDRWDVDLNSGLALNLDANYDEILSSIENLELGRGNDEGYGTDGANEIWGRDGNDTIRGRGGSDTLHGDRGVDHLYGGAGNDTLDPGAGNDFAYGEGGNDTVTYAWSVRGVDVDLAADQASGLDIGTDVVAGIENAIGGGGSDRLYGDGAGNRLEGGGSFDVLVGLGGTDHLFGGEGNDVLMPGVGNDTVNGGDGGDMVDYSDTWLHWTVDLSGGTASAVLGLGVEYHQTLSGIETAVLGTGNDTVYGTSGDNSIAGYDGNDLLHGGGGNDTLYGGNGNDTLYGGPGEDLMSGDDGDDIFLFRDESELTTVDDFTDGSDLIGLNMTDYVSFDDLAIEADADGNAVIYMGPRQITLVGVSTGAIDNSDFIWL